MVKEETLVVREADSLSSFDLAQVPTSIATKHKGFKESEISHVNKTIQDVKVRRTQFSSNMVAQRDEFFDKERSGLLWPGVRLELVGSDSFYIIVE